MDENRKEELEEIYKEYMDIVEFIPKKEYKDSLQDTERIKLFVNLYNQKQLNRATKNLFWITVFLFGVAGLQLMKELQGVDATKNFINQAAQIAVYIFLAYAAFQILKSIVDFSKKVYYKLKRK